MTIIRMSTSGFSGGGYEFTAIAKTSQEARQALMKEYLKKDEEAKEGGYKISRFTPNRVDCPEDLDNYYGWEEFEFSDLQLPFVHVQNF